MTTFTSFRGPALLAGLFILASGPKALSAQAGPVPEATPHVHGDHSAAAATIFLRDDLGSYSRAITTQSALAQQYFDQGLRYQYGFNHEEAIESYRSALDADPDCAMCWWGIALAAGPNINAGATEEGEALAWQAIQEALHRAGNASAIERELISALAKRYGTPPMANREERDRAYADAMERLAGAYPSDPDVLTLYGAARMNLDPWNYWEGDYGARVPRAGTSEILATLKGALERSPDHPGACHYFIHAVEAGEPERAVPCAERLADLMPGAGHIVHMPGHIYIRVGRYYDAVLANQHAVHADEAHFSEGAAADLYAGTYYPHNYHFLAFAATMAGMSETALEAARVVAPKVPTEVALDFYWIQNAIVLPELTDLTFGRWESVLAAPAPAPELEQATIMHEYARGVALAALGEMEGARAILAELEAGAQKRADRDAATNPIPFMAPEALAGEIALRTGDTEAAVDHLRNAADIEDALLYDEPPLWYRPVRQSLGRAQLEAGQFAEAERSYREDLDRFPENGWSLYGLAQSLEAQGRGTEAEAVRRRFDAAWAHADVELTSSGF